MADFTEAIQRQKAERTPEKDAPYFSGFCDLKDTINGATIAGITDLQLKSENYKTVLVIQGTEGSSKEGKEFAKITIETEDGDGYDTLVARINDEIAEEAFGADVEILNPRKYNNWQLKYTAKDGDDTFNFDVIVNGAVITAKIDNYVNDSTQTKMETWADTIPELSDGVES